MGLMNWFKEMRKKKNKPVVGKKVVKASKLAGQNKVPMRLNRQTRRAYGQSKIRFTEMLRAHYAQKNLDKMFSKELNKYTKAINDLPSSEIENLLKVEIKKGFVKRRGDGRWVFTQEGADNMAKTWGKEAA